MGCTEVSQKHQMKKSQVTRMLENSSLPQPQIAREKQKSGTGKSLAVRKPFIHF